MLAYATEEKREPCTRRSIRRVRVSSAPQPGRIPKLLGCDLEQLRSCNGCDLHVRSPRIDDAHPAEGAPDGPPLLRRALFGKIDVLKGEESIRPADHGSLVFIGDCTQGLSEEYKGTFVPGCPPDPMRSRRARSVRSIGVALDGTSLMVTSRDSRRFVPGRRLAVVARPEPLLFMRYVLVSGVVGVPALSSRWGHDLAYEQVFGDYNWLTLNILFSSTSSFGLTRKFLLHCAFTLRLGAVMAALPSRARRCRGALAIDPRNVNVVLHRRVSCSWRRSSARDPGSRSTSSTTA